jgi:DNA-binding LytR/AlgR family response regulator
MSCLVVDDEQAAIDTLASYIHATEDLTYKGGIIMPAEARDLLLAGNDLPDILFLDLEMKAISGAVLAEIAAGKTMIVFSTGHADFAVQSYEYGAVDYLLKPFSYERFLKAIEKCRQLKELSTNDPGFKSNSITIADSRTARNWIVQKDHIAYISAFGNYCKVFLADGTHLMPLMSLTNFYDSLKSDHFIRVHRSWAIHIKQVKDYNKDSVTLHIGPEIKVGRVYKPALKKWLQKYGKV